MTSRMPTMLPNTPAFHLGSSVNFGSMDKSLTTQGVWVALTKLETFVWTYAFAFSGDD